ncbi:MAG: glycoside hydrolase family 38 C-terminal domain-containing protein, partial [Candidatus Aminicenantales bacterium]
MFRTHRPLAVLAALALILSGAALAAAPAPEAKLKIEVKPTILFAEEGGAVLQRVDLAVDYDGPAAPAKVTIRGFRRPIGLSVASLAPGRSSIPVLVPDLIKPARITFQVAVGKAKDEKEMMLAPQRKWTLYLLPHTHTDIGYTDLQTRVTKNHVEYLDAVIEFCKATDGYPDEAKFRWNIEASWGLENFLRTRPADKIAELVALLRSGRVELSAWYVNQSDGFSHEELIRAAAIASGLSRMYGFPLRAAMNNDVTGFSWAAPQILNQIGVKYFTTGINEDRSRAPLRRPNPFYWESPSGAKVLHWNGEHYLFANYELSLHEAYEKSFPKVVDYLTRLQARGDFPYDTMAFHISGYVTDNCPPRKELSDRVRDWNSKWAYPKLRLATMSEFFGALEKKYGKTIPTYKKGWPDYWTDGAGSTSFETGLNRMAHGEIVAAEAWAVAAGLTDKDFVFPRDEIREAYKQNILYDEHTWGAWNSISDPESEFVRGQWGIKAGYAYSAREIAKTVRSRALAAIVRRIPTGEGYSLAVFNPLSWSRVDMVRTPLPPALVDKPGKFKLIEKTTGAEVPYQLVDKTTLLFQANAVPSMGYSVYTIVPDVRPSTPAPAAEIGAQSIENRFFKVLIDPISGGIASLIDKETGAELVDRKAPYTLNQFIYENPKGGREAVNDMRGTAQFNRYSPVAASCAPGLRGPGASSLVVTAKAFRNPEIRQEIVLYDGIKRIDIIDRLKKEETTDSEAAYFAFPFGVAGGKFRFEIADGAMAPETDQLPNTVRDWQAVQSWVELAGTKNSVVWAPVEAPLVQFGDLNTGKWLKTLNLKNGTLFSYALNNYWNTNFKASQGGTLVFRYSLTARPGAADPVKSTRFGWEVQSPLTAVWLAEKNKGTLPGDS